MKNKEKAVDVEEATALNLVPMVDIMFLMLLFFMLGSDMGQRELEDVTLPVASSVKADEGNAGSRTTINVYHDGRSCEDYAKGETCRNHAHWKVGIRGRDFNPQSAESMALLTTVVQKLADDSRVVLTDRVSELLVMIRADKAAPYGAVQQVMNVCATCGVYKVEAGAAEPPR